MVPYLTLGLVTVPYLDNPFMKTYARFIIVSIGVFWMLFALELTELSWYILLGIGFGFGIVCLLLELVKTPKVVTEIIYEIVSVFSAIGWISVFANVVVDFISFLAFYFSIDKVILSTILLSIGNSIGDFFGNAALAK